MQPKYDVIVAGGGSAGSAAAIAAARGGAKVLLLEEANCLGGTATHGLVNEIFSNLDGVGDILTEVCFMLGQNHLPRPDRFFNGEMLKFVWQYLAQQAGVEILFHASVFAAEVVEGRVTTVKFACCGQALEAAADWFIDCTGEGDLAAMAGAKFMKGDPEHGRQIAMTLMFQLIHSKVPVTPYLPPGITPYASESDISGLNVCVDLAEGRIYCNMSKIMELDSTDPEALTCAELNGREEMFQIIHYLQRTKYPDALPIASGGTIGIREGRRIIGENILTFADLQAGKSFADGTVVATTQVDFHSLTRKGATGWHKVIEPYAIPFGCMIAKGFSNLLMAGKCISVDQIVHSSCRMTPSCCGMGQVCGIAAALAVRGNWPDIRKLAATELRQHLAQSGFELDPQKHRKFYQGDHEGTPEDAT